MSSHPITPTQKSLHSSTSNSTTKHSHSGSHDSSNKTKSNNTEPINFGSKVVISRIQAPESVIPTDPPKIILKRKEIQVYTPRPRPPEEITTFQAPPAEQPPPLTHLASLDKEFESINESQDMPMLGDETSNESPTPKPANTTNALEAQTRREPSCELMEDGNSQEIEQKKLPDQPTTSDLEESQTRKELQSELMKEETLQEPITVVAITCVQASSRRNSQESQSVDCDFLEAILKKQLEEDANLQVSLEEVTVYIKAPTTSTQLGIDSQPHDNKRSTLKDLQDVSYIIMSPNTPDKEDLILGEESETAMVNACQFWLAHEEEIQVDRTMQSSLTTIDTLEADQDNDVTLCEDPGLESQGWDLMNEILSCQGKRRQWEPEGGGRGRSDDRNDWRPDKTVTNEDCIAVVFNYMPDDDLSIPD